MGLTYFKRYRMQIDLAGRDLTPPAMPSEYRFLPWDKSLLDAHAQAKHLSFREEIDANLFSCFGDLAGCRRLMNEIVRKEGFLPAATWLAVFTAGPEEEVCGTIQGIRNRSGIGSVQNLGITPGYRDRGLGTSLLFRSLLGFQRSGLQRVCLEVTADNQGAVRLYRRCGFKTVKTLFKAAEVAYS